MKIELFGRDKDDFYLLSLMLRPLYLDALMASTRKHFFLELCLEGGGVLPHLES